MFPPFRLGRLFGIPVDIRASFLALLAVVLLFTGGWTGLFGVLLAFSSVIAHEYGHALVPRHLGVGVSGIELHFFGGVAKLTSQPKSANDEIAIAAAGPLVSAGLSSAAFALGALSGWGFFHLLGTINLIIFAFNLIPALPMDGGRIFRAAVSKYRGFRSATDLAVKVSRGFSIAFAIFGIAFGHFQLVLLAGVLWMMASAEKYAARFHSYRESSRQRRQESRDASSGDESGWFSPRKQIDPAAFERGRVRQRIVVVRYE